MIVLIKSVVNKKKNNHYNNILLEKGLYKNKSNIENFFHECLYICKCFISIELIFLKELMLIKQVQQKSVIFVTIRIFLNYSSKISTKYMQ